MGLGFFFLPKAPLEFPLLEAYHTPGISGFATAGPGSGPQVTTGARLHNTQKPKLKLIAYIMYPFDVSGFANAARLLATMGSRSGTGAAPIRPNRCGGDAVPMQHAAAETREASGRVGEVRDVARRPETLGDCGSTRPSLHQCVDGVHLFRPQ